ncbi:hypothetical protein CEP54_010999 [Fusarium duplospermum]|uniref:Uncharacterized protein n=1 Tax=Fusarium duplospermum TaxID=1325734 RepID=A0A428PGM9_9HYPO|nr:hypothetical protein CEP54_010999 [Fusarium duplospermum]
MSDEASDLIVTTISSKFMGLEDRLSKIENPRTNRPSLPPPTEPRGKRGQHIRTDAESSTGRHVPANRLAPLRRRCLL